MKRLTSAQLFAPPIKAHKTKARLERAKSVVVSTWCAAHSCPKASKSSRFAIFPSARERRTSASCVTRARPRLKWSAPPAACARLQAVHALFALFEQRIPTLVDEWERRRGTGR